METIFSYNNDKNLILKIERGVSFEDIIEAIYNNKILAIHSHHNQLRYKHQRILIVEIENYAYEVPYVLEENKIFFKTIFPSRKSTNQYLRRGKK